GQRDVTEQLIAAFARFNLPTSLKALDVDIQNHADVDKVIARTLAPFESIHALPVPLSAENLRDAIERVEALSV
ncbi:oxidoreductase, partial [Candidatus Symbiopectobacterium sp. NZEC135]|nr:oxidoreductase [Candidatus Symbiopectobacterium sp. NZEC135]